MRESSLTNQGEAAATTAVWLVAGEGGCREVGKEAGANPLPQLAQCPCVATGSWNSLQELYKDNAC